MDDAYIPTTLMHHRRPLRGVMIDRQPWVCAREFARLLGHRHPERICRLMDADQVRVVDFRLASGQLEAVEVLSESGMYRALWRFSHPEKRHLCRWLRKVEKGADLFSKSHSGLTWPHAGAVSPVISHRVYFLNLG